MHAIHVDGDGKVLPVVRLSQAQAQMARKIKIAGFCLGNLDALSGLQPSTARPTRDVIGYVEALTHAVILSRLPNRLECTWVSSVLAQFKRDSISSQ